jgi:hypothetical protein
MVAQGKLTPEKFVSHRLTFEALIDAHDTFGRAAETKALKVAISADTPPTARSAGRGPGHRGPKGCRVDRA